MAKQRVAIFDIDGTIFRSSLLIEITEALVKEGIWKSSVIAQYSAARGRWMDRKGSYDDYIQDVIEAFHKNIKGLPQTTFRKIAIRVVAEHKDRTYRYTRDLVKDLRKRNYSLLAISHSPKEAVEQFCRHLGFHKVYGQLFEVGANGRYTGKVEFQELIKDKGVILSRALEKGNFSLIGSIGVGDTESDIGFLSMVDNPICFNPNRQLLQAARRRAWKIVVERKDVIYKI
ncbi:MAG: HAD-IB family hydrolase [Candidatus Kerfeldbacteria bacterium]